MAEFGQQNGGIACLGNGLYTWSGVAVKKEGGEAAVVRKSGKRGEDKGS